MSWQYYSRWETSDGNRWIATSADKLRKAWSFKLSGELKQAIPSPNGNLAVFSGKESVSFLDQSGEVLWNADVLTGARSHYRFPTFLIGASWLYEECLLADLASERPIHIDPRSGQILKRFGTGSPPPDSVKGEPYSSLKYPVDGSWYTVLNGLTCRIRRDLRLESAGGINPKAAPGWFGGQSGGELFSSEESPHGPVLFTVNVLISCGRWTVYYGFASGPAQRHLRVVKDKNYAGGVVIPDGVEAIIAEDSGILVSIHHNQDRDTFWMEGRHLEDLHTLLWRTDTCGRCTWLLGTGGTVWHNWEPGPYAKGKNWLIGRDIASGEEVFRKEENCWFTGMNCGQRIVTMNRRTLTGWDIEG